jgi:hypothetical protein
MMLPWLHIRNQPRSVKSERLDDWGGVLKHAAYTGFRMFRSLVSIAVLVGFIAGQLAAMPHAHAFATVAEQHRHDSRPHVHLGHSHGHGHRHQCDSHDNEPVVPDGGSTHDADATYLPPTHLPATIPVSVEKAGQDHRAQIGHWVSTFFSCALQIKPSIGHACWHPPDADAPSCALFLKLRTLRI